MTYRTKPLDPDNRPNPRTDLYCVRCNRDLKPTAKRFCVHVVAGGAQVLHPEDEEAWLQAGPHDDDLGVLHIGRCCAKTLGMEWTWPA